MWLILSLETQAPVRAWQQLFNEMEFDTENEETKIECGNKQAVRMITMDNPTFRTNIRHIHISELWLRQEHAAGRINVQWVETGKMEADGLTKPLPKAKLDLFIKQLGLRDVEHLVRKSS